MNWKPDHVRLFISHLAKYKQFAFDVAALLEAWGIHGFVAHTSIRVSKQWGDEIQDALKSMDVLVGLAHPGWNKSVWVQQEVGWAYARAVPVLIIRIGEDPKGLLAPTQWPSAIGASAGDMATEITSWLNTETAFSERLGDGAIRALANSRSFYESRDAAERLQALGTLTDDQLDALADAYWSNNQVYGSVWAAPRVQGIFESHGRKRRPDPPPGHPLAK